MAIEIYKRQGKDENSIELHNFNAVMSSKEFAQIYLNTNAMKELRDELNRLRLK